MISNPLVSVVVPVYNKENYLKECIDSILGQTYQNIECILVDDGSTDLSGSICDNYVKKDNRICTIHKVNGGVVSSRAEGVKHANGTWIYFVDSDDTICSDTIACITSYIDNSIDIISFEENTNRIYPKEEYVAGLLTRTLKWSNCARLYRKELFDEYVFGTHRYFNVGEDFLTSLRICKNLKGSVLTCNIHKYNYRIVTGSAMSQYKHSLDYESKIISEVDFIIKTLDLNVKEAHFHYKTMMLGGMIGLRIIDSFDKNWIKDIVEMSKTVKMNLRQKITIMATYNVFCENYLIMERTLKEFIRKLLKRR